MRFQPAADGEPMLRDIVPLAAEVRPRPGRRSRLGTGTLACPACDAPVVPPAEGLRPSDALRCPFCAHAGPVRFFLSLAVPARPARVTLHVVPR